MDAAKILFSLSDWNNSTTNPIKNIGPDNTEKIYRPEDNRPKIFLNSQLLKEIIRNNRSPLFEAPKNFSQNLPAAHRYPRKNGAAIKISISFKSCFIESLHFPA
ncbi:MAG: hypothetical protein K2I96_10580 [Lachnospiraceae bacterium]|nr:hypothetical protein [Lachnospiraceae bacterium]